MHLDYPKVQKGVPSLLYDYSYLFSGLKEVGNFATLLSKRRAIFKHGRRPREKITRVHTERSAQEPVWEIRMGEKSRK